MALKIQFLMFCREKLYKKGFYEPFSKFLAKLSDQITYSQSAK